MVGSSYKTTSTGQKSETQSQTGNKNDAVPPPSSEDGFPAMTTENITLTYLNYHFIPCPVCWRHINIKRFQFILINKNNTGEKFHR